MDGVGHSGNQGPEEVARDAPGGTLMELSIGKLAGSIDGYKEIELALLSPHLGDIDMEVADRVLLELLLRNALALISGKRLTP